MHDLDQLYEQFEDWPSACDASRERNVPIYATVLDEGSDGYVDVKIYPSGTIKEIRDTRCFETNS